MLHKSAMPVLSIQSQVVYGHVGNSAALLPLMLQGIEVWPVPTAILSHHPGHGKPAGEIRPAAQVAALVAGLAERGLLADCRAVLSGWLGSAENGAAVLDTVRQVRAAQPAALYLCDPVIGDRDTGIYVPAPVAAFLRDRALPAADIVTPNQFELEWLTGQTIGTLPEAIAAARAALARGPKIVLCTSLKRRDGGLAGPPGGGLETLAATAEGIWIAATPELNQAPHGAGDMFSALFLARLLRGKSVKKALAFAVAATYGVLRASVERQSPEPLLVAARDELIRPTFDPPVERVG